jgi:hypothetical protein
MRIGDGYRTRSRRRYVGGPQLARFNGSTITHPSIFGGGYPSAVIGTRQQTVAYGYAAVIEEFEEPEVGACWATLSVMLPNGLPNLVVDHRSALGSADVPPEGEALETGDLEFDVTYATTTTDLDKAAPVLTRDLRSVLLWRPVQRMSLSGARLLLRTFDGEGATRAMGEWLHEMAGEVLKQTPAFYDQLHEKWTTFPPGITGPRL